MKEWRIKHEHKARKKEGWMDIIGIDISGHD